MDWRERELRFCSSRFYFVVAFLRIFFIFSSLRLVSAAGRLENKSVAERPNMLAKSSAILAKEIIRRKFMPLALPLWGYAIFLLTIAVNLPDAVLAARPADSPSAAALANAAPAETGTSSGELGRSLPLWSGFPFAGILLSIALMPLLMPRFWHHHFGKVTAAWALVFAIPFVFAFHGAAMHEILHIFLKDYIPFIILLWALYTVAGGILLEGAPAGTPFTNTVMLAIGTLIASGVGTTGASMLMIRPMLRMNQQRRNRIHLIIFFIFLVSNIGGSLTPLGDPPLFLGFLHGVPFFWTLQLLPEMLTVFALVLGLFFIFDLSMFRREKIGAKSARVQSAQIRIRGLHNLVFLAGIIGGVLLSGLVKWGEFNFFGIPLAVQDEIRDLILIAMGLLSLKFTAKEIREGNGFTWGPIQEVAILFAGIFMTIIPMLAMLKAGTEGALAFIIGAVREPWHYFWASGSLSSFLDNAPTYLTFMNTALGRFYPGQPELEAVRALIAENGIYLKAISCGAVFMGANTYIGNAPNFMVKSIAEENGIKMPSFFGYMLYSLLILIPSFILVTFIFF
jgi:Na+/H+ antiporter NhaD/arsenite permease-like protein